MERLPTAIVLVAVFVIPTAIAEASVALGDFPTAVFEQGRTTRFFVGKAKLTDPAGHRAHHLVRPSLYHQGDLPYTVSLTADKLRTYFDGANGYPISIDDESFNWSPNYVPQDEIWAARLLPSSAHPIELRYFRLKHGQVILEWADTLYRRDDPSSIQRARELYKAVLCLHGEATELSPNWDKAPLGVVAAEKKNPWLLSQLARARKGITQIDMGLNYFGYTDDIVPILRYRTLKEAADRFAALAKAAQSDFLNYLQQTEAGLLEAIKNGAMVRKAALQAELAGQLELKSRDTMSLAQKQVDQVKEAIQAKQKEIEDHDSFSGQVGDFVKGLVSAVKDLPEDTKSTVGAGVVAEAGIEPMKGSGFLGMGPAASVTAGFGVFAYAGYVSLSSMSDQANKRQGELNTLMNYSLSAAEGQLVVQTRELRIAQLQKLIAEGESDLIKNVITFQNQRFLNLELWSNMASILKRVMRRYLELGARAAWFAERALAYEQDRSIGILRFDYFPPQLQGLSGVDQLQLDLAELEATRLEGIKQSAPIKHTFSLVRDFPLAFGQLKATGRCSIWTQDLPLIAAHPGTYAHRVRAVSVLVITASAASPVRGMLTNQGVSRTSRIGSDGTREQRTSIRPPDGFPVSEFRLNQDLEVYGLPDEALLPFEGSGVETLWSLEFPNAANPYGLGVVTDVLLTLDVRANYSPHLYNQDVVSRASNIQRFVWISAKEHAHQSLADLRGAAPQVVFVFDIRKLSLPSQEKNRQVVNVALLLASAKPTSIRAGFATTAPARAVMVTLDQGIAYSNADPITNAQSTVAMSPLNAVVSGVTADQVFRLTIKKSDNPNADFGGVIDVAFGLEYKAEIA